MENVILKNGKTYTTTDSYGTWRYVIENGGTITPKSNELTGDTINPHHQAEFDDVISKAIEVAELFGEQLLQNSEISDADEISCTNPEQTVFIGFSDGLKEKITRIYFKNLPSPLSGGGKGFNTDVIVCNDGEITTHDYFGSVDHRGDNIAFVIKIGEQDKGAWVDLWREGMTEEQADYCKTKGWDAVWESNSNNPEDWEEFEIDLDEFKSNWNMEGVFEQKKAEILEHFEQMELNIAMDSFYKRKLQQ